MQEDQSMNPSNKDEKMQRFTELFSECPHCVFDTLSYMDIIKPLLWTSLAINGGKLSYRAAARKYRITPRQAWTIIQNIKNLQK